MTAPSTVDQAFVKQYETDVHTAYQRMGSKLRGTVRSKSNIRGQSTTFQKVGKGTASTKSRHGLVPVMNVDHTPVECTLADYYAGEWCDALDELKTNIDERQVAVNAGAYALGRKTDDLIILQLDAGTHYTNANLSTLAKGDLTSWVTSLGALDVPMDDGQLFGIVTWAVWNKMLQITEFVSADYVGEDQMSFKGGIRPKNWLGVIWMPHTGINTYSSRTYNAIYHKTAVGHASGADVMSDITWHGDRASHFINNMMSQGAKLIDTDGVWQLRVAEGS